MGAVILSMEQHETFDQKVIRNVQAGGFAVYKTPDVVGAQTQIANIEWEDPEQVDKFFIFAKNLGAKIIYVAERDEEQEDGSIKTSLAQIGFLYEGIMHHINLEDDEEDDEEDDGYEEYDEEESEDTEELSVQEEPRSQEPAQEEPSTQQWPRPQY